MDTAKFQNILAENQKRMLDPNFNRLVEQKAGNFSGSKNNAYSSDISYLEQQAFGGGNNVTQVQQMPSTGDFRVRSDSKVPEFIKESFRNTPPIQVPDNSSPMANLMSTGGLNEMFNNQQVAQPQQNYNQQFIPQTGGVDYGIIKAIVNECISSQMNDMKNNILNECTNLKGLRFAGGNKIQFIDSKGDLYEGVLTLKKKKSK